MKITLFFAVLVTLSCALNNGLGRTPQMAWNSWNHYQCDINETVMMRTIDAMVSTGLLAAGYTYVNIDDCWASTRLANGTITSDPVTFPSGMEALVNYAHSRGLKFGLYSDAGYKTCAGRPGSLGYEQIDADTYAAWGVDYLKYDNCNTDGSIPEKRYPVMRDALNNTGKPIFFSLCEWGVDNPATWAPKVGNSWRTTGDVDMHNDWFGILDNLDQYDVWWSYAGPGGWNDPDILEVGNGGLSTVESKSHFFLWVISKAPLLIGCDVTNMDPDISAILTAPEVIAVNQDPLGVQGHMVVSNENITQIWAGPLVDGSVAAILLNRNSSNSESITVNWKDIGLTAGDEAIVRDLWLRKNLGTFTSSFTASVDSHDSLMIRVIPLSMEVRKSIVDKYSK